MTNSIESLTESDARELMRESMMILSDRITSDAARIFNDDYSDDDTDYFPARAATLARFIFILTNADESLLDALRDIATNRDNALDDYETCDIDMPLDDYLIRD